MNINIIGVPIKYGSDIDGVQYGPDKLRDLGMISIIENNKNKIYDMGNIYVPYYSGDLRYKWHPKMKYLNPIVEVNTNLAHAVYCSLKSDCFPLIIGGDHSIGMGSIAGSSKYYGDIAVVWVDAHGDINDYNTTPSGNVHGMPLASSLGYGHDLIKDLYFSGNKVKPENVYIIGARDLDPGEVELAERLNLNLYTMDSIRERGLDEVMKEVTSQLKDLKVNAVHLSFDIDAMDSHLIPGTGTPVPNGFSMEESKKVLEDLLKTDLIRSMDFVEYNPKLDNEEEITGKISIELLEHIGKFI